LLVNCLCCSFLSLPGSPTHTSHSCVARREEEEEEEEEEEKQQQQLLLLQPLEVPGIFPSVEFESADGTTGFSVF
jgi:CO dehydrogenase/acetyl-CoA synthase beta subunit